LDIIFRVWKRIGEAAAAKSEQQRYKPAEKRNHSRQVARVGRTARLAGRTFILGCVQ